MRTAMRSSSARLPACSMSWSTAACRHWCSVTRWNSWRCRTRVWCWAFERSAGAGDASLEVAVIDLEFGPGVDRELDLTVAAYRRWARGRA